MSSARYLAAELIDIENISCCRWQFYAGVCVAEPS